MFNGIIQTILVAMKTSRACAGMQSYENDAFKFSKTEKKITYKQHVHQVYHSSRARGSGSFPQTSLPLTVHIVNYITRDNPKFVYVI